MVCILVFDNLLFQKKVRRYSDLAIVTSSYAFDWRKIPKVRSCQCLLLLLSNDFPVFWSHETLSVRTNRNLTAWPLSVLF